MSSETLTILAMVAGCAVFAGAVTYPLVGRDFQGGARVVVTLITTVLVGGMSLIVLYLSVAVFLAVAVAYLVVRHLLRPGLALAASGVVLAGGFFCAVMIMFAALSNM
ncbi:hypothetical protein [Actinomadura sp. 7K507]|uniref:hypothetical protein n=1 Tax=Actinomadura sp. 7K507 TaxID=2530365 RepID=UPI00104C38F1|nr:hypothetical protein [Actinomadura sp. 7K507]TDC80153.1 hypothetical protein E1285_35200 [Actinomadura sp. 7K507]